MTVRFTFLFPVLHFSLSMESCQRTSPGRGTTPAGAAEHQDIPKEETPFLFAGAKIRRLFHSTKTFGHFFLKKTPFSPFSPRKRPREAAKGMGGNILYLRYGSNKIKLNWEICASRRKFLDKPSGRAERSQQAGWTIALRTSIVYGIVLLSLP